MKRVLVFSLAYYPRFVAGAEVAVKEITDRLAAQGFTFDMVTIGDGRNLDGRLKGSAETIGNVIVHRVFKDIGPIQKLFFPFAAYFKACSLHKKQPYDAIWSIMAARAGFAALFFKWKKPQVPFILTLQEGDRLDYAERRAGPVAPLVKYIFRSADRITAISNFLADWAKSMGAKCPISLVPNGVDYDVFSTFRPNADLNALKTKLGKKENDVFLVTTSRLVAKNAVGDIIDALQYLPPNVKLLILGAGEIENDLKARAIKLRLNSAESNRIIFVGHIEHANLPAYLQISDIFVRPSLSEGLGNSFLEAMAAGIPVIATPVGGIPDFLKDGETGLFCETNNPRSIAQKAEKLMKDRESRDYITGRARDLVRMKYSWTGTAAGMKSAFDSATLKK